METSNAGLTVYQAMQVSFGRTWAKMLGSEAGKGGGCTYVPGPRLRRGLRADKGVWSLWWREKPQKTV